MIGLYELTLKQIKLILDVKKKLEVHMAKNTGKSKKELDALERELKTKVNNRVAQNCAFKNVKSPKQK